MSELAVPVSATRDHIQGNTKAPVTLVEYGDYQCPSCGQAFPIVKRLQKHFGDKLCFVFRNFPLPMHHYAEHAAETAEWAAKQGKFWEMHDLLFEHQGNLQDPALLKLATDLGLSSDDLTKALDDGIYKQRIAEDLESGNDSDVRGTPSFYLNGESFDDSYDFVTFSHAIESLAS